MATCAIECTCGTWGGTYLVEAHAMNPDTAAGLILFYFPGVALGRFVAGILSEWMRVYRICYFSVCNCNKHCDYGNSVWVTVFSND